MTECFDTITRSAAEEKYPEVAKRLDDAPGLISDIGLEIKLADGQILVTFAGMHWEYDDGSEPYSIDVVIGGSDDD